MEGSVVRRREGDGGTGEDAVGTSRGTSEIHCALKILVLEINNTLISKTKIFNAQLTKQHFLK